MLLDIPCVTEWLYFLVENSIVDHPEPPRKLAGVDGGCMEQSFSPMKVWFYRQLTRDGSRFISFACIELITYVLWS